MLSLKMFCSILFLLLVSLASVDSITVTGRIFCDGNHYPLSYVYLMEQDQGDSMIDSDDHLGYGHVDKEGRFKIEGVQWEMFQPQYFLAFNHTCKGKSYTIFVNI